MAAASLGVLDMGAEIGDLDDRAVTSDSTVMILTCPECSTSYFVEDSSIGQGRAVRCAGCGASWRARIEAPLELKVSPEEGAVGAPASAADDDLFERPAAALPAEVLPKAFRARAEAERKTREAAVQGAVWAGMGAALALLLTVGVVFRIDVVRLWPKTASAYAAVGLPVNRVGLVIENVHALPALQDGHAALQVSGVLRNVRARAVAIPPLSIVLLDKSGRRIFARSALAGDSVGPGQTRSFSISVLDPPIAAADLEVSFLADRPSARRNVQSVGLLRPAASPLPAASRAMMLGSVEEARPLPSGSPFALSKGAASSPSAGN